MASPGRLSHFNDDHHIVVYSRAITLYIGHCNRLLESSDETKTKGWNWKSAILNLLHFRSKCSSPCKPSSQKLFTMLIVVKHRYNPLPVLTATQIHPFSCPYGGADTVTCSHEHWPSSLLNCQWGYLFSPLHKTVVCFACGNRFQNWLFLRPLKRHWWLSWDNNLFSNATWKDPKNVVHFNAEVHLRLSSNIKPCK